MRELISLAANPVAKGCIYTDFRSRHSVRCIASIGLAWTFHLPAFATHAPPPICSPHPDCSSMRPLPRAMDSDVPPLPPKGVTHSQLLLTFVPLGLVASGFVDVHVATTVARSGSG
jgi:hypothetical protein